MFYKERLKRIYYLITVLGLFCLILSLDFRQKIIEKL